MAHDATKVLFGQVPSSDKVIDTHAADPASFPAGLAVCKTSGNGLSLLQSAGEVIGISMGKSLSDIAKTDVCRVGNDVPVRVRAVVAELEIGDLTFYSKLFQSELGNNISIELLDTDVAAGCVVTVTDRLISLSIESGVTTALTIKTAVDASAAASALVSVVIADGESAAAQVAAAEDNLAGGSVAFVAPGAVVYVDDETGEICKSTEDNAQVTGAFFSSEILTGIYEFRGTEYLAAKIDMAGGL